MSDAPTSELEKQLGELTTWNGPAPELWKRALKTAGAAAGHTGRLWRIGSRIPDWLVVGAAAAVVFFTVGILMRSAQSDQSSGVRGTGQGMTVYSNDNADWFSATASGAGDAFGAGAYQGRGQFVAGGAVKALEGSDGDGGVVQRLGKRGDAQWESAARELHTVVGDQTATPARAGTSSMGIFSTSAATQPFVAPSSADTQDNVRNRGEAERQVVRKAAMDLVAKDVRAAFAKAAYLVSEARGEFVQESSLTGSGERIEANLTLRVAADRLSEVLNELRQLGEVKSERTTGEDVTGQVVDLEARLRNEQRVEKELLELLDKRSDAPLKEILEVRNSISGVRQSIEQLTAQREKLGRLVSLATVLVIIRPSDAPPEPKDTGLAGYFFRVLDRAWRKGVLFLMDTLAGVLSILIGGLVWWILLAVAVLVVRSCWRRRAAAQS